MNKANVINCLFMGLVAVWLFLICVSARAETFCERQWAAYQGGAAWDRNCGPEPGKPYKTEMQKDCAITREKIRSREGASWNSEYGWAIEDQCEAIEQEAQL
jgi:hypothetical protein